MALADASSGSNGRVSPSTVDFRVLTYNVRALRDDRAAVADVVRRCDPDVVCLQETPRFLRWRSRCAELARECGLLYVVGGRTTGGVALMAHLRVDVCAMSESRLSKRPRLHQRGLAAAVVEKSGGRLLVASSHLGLDGLERTLHAREVLDRMTPRSTPYAVVAGDLNEPPGGNAWKILRGGGMRDPAPQAGPTFPAREPAKRIDAVLVSEGVDVVDYRTVDDAAVARASDHRPVLAVVRIPR